MTSAFLGLHGRYVLPYLGYDAGAFRPGLVLIGRRIHHSLILGIGTAFTFKFLGDCIREDPITSYPAFPKLRARQSGMAISCLEV